MNFIDLLASFQVKIEAHMAPVQITAKQGAGKFNPSMEAEDHSSAISWKQTLNWDSQ